MLGAWILELRLAEALDVGGNKMDWLETYWSQALLLIQVWSSHGTRTTGGHGVVHEARGVNMRHGVVHEETSKCPCAIRVHPAC
jgi:hypothetical protein